MTPTGQQHTSGKQRVAGHKRACVVLVVVEEMHADILLSQEVE